MNFFGKSLIVALALAPSVSAAKGGKKSDPEPAPVVEEEPLYAPGEPQCENWHKCDCFTCGDVTPKEDGTMDIQINHCKGDTISWICLTGVDGVEGAGDVTTCGGAKKCTDQDSGEFTINIPQDSTTFQINTHDGKTAGDSLNVQSICGGPKGGQGGSCATGDFTAHCLIDFDVLSDCGYDPGEDKASEFEEHMTEETIPRDGVDEPTPVDKDESPPLPPSDGGDDGGDETPADDSEGGDETPADDSEGGDETPAEEEQATEEDSGDKSGGGFAQNTCSKTEWVPFDNTDSPTGMVRCCAGQHGKNGEEFGKCDTSSCRNNFNGKDRTCFNYGAPQNGKNAKDNAGSAICPYADSDHAICDTSFYDALNPEACRTNSNGKNFQVHCLGKVKCNTKGVNVPKNGHSDGTAEYDDSGETECLGAAEGFKAGQDCFYNGASENWKVCEPDAPATAPVETKSVDPLPNPAKGSGSGDPHFKTWTGDKYDYHGECDLVLVDNPTFMDGKGLRIHIRTTRVKYFSYIEKVAVQIGGDVLEFDNDVEKFLVNGKLAETNHKHHKTMVGGFVVRRDKKALSIRLADNGSAKSHHHKGAKIDLHTRKNGFPAVIVDAGHTEVFAGSLGLLGDWETGRKLARDGKTEIEVHPHDATAFALEWQVRDTEPMLFKDARFPQFPTTCTPPAKRVADRLGFSNFQKEAEAACAHWKEDKEDCLFDVIATRDVLVAQEGHIVHLE